jgi:RNA polymerase sigma-70 factor (ECF subfamily)
MGRPATITRYNGAVDVDEVVSELARRGRTAWPELDLPNAILLDHLAGKIGDQPADAPTLHAEDLYLACACALGLAEAIAAFEARHLAQVRVFLGRMKPTPSLIDEVKQGLRVKLLVAPPGEVPRIAEYAGRGSLTSWLRVAAIRLAIDLLQASGAAAPSPGPAGDDLLDRIGGGDPELELLKARHRSEVNDVLREAFAALSAEQRNVLRLSYRDGRSIDEIGALLGAHRATAARWIADARQAILDEARRRLEARLGLSPTEVQSLLRMLRSQLHLSVSRLLRE